MTRKRKDSRSCAGVASSGEILPALKIFRSKRFERDWIYLNQIVRPNSLTWTAGKKSSHI
jgi:hypothetical protein